MGKLFCIYTLRRVLAFTFDENHLFPTSFTKYFQTNLQNQIMWDRESVILINTDFCQFLSIVNFYIYFEISQFWGFTEMFSFPEILSFKLFSNSCGNSYIQFVVIFLFDLWRKQTTIKDEKVSKCFVIVRMYHEIWISLL